MPGDKDARYDVVLLGSSIEGSIKVEAGGNTSTNSGTKSGSAKFTLPKRVVTASASRRAMFTLVFCFLVGFGAAVDGTTENREENSIGVTFPLKSSSGLHGLTEISRRLRGLSPNGIDPFKIKQVATDVSDNIKAIQKLHRDGTMGDAGALLEATIISDTAALNEVLMEAKELGFEPPKTHLTSDVISKSLKDISHVELAKSFDPESLDQIAKISNDVMKLVELQPDHHLMLNSASAERKAPPNFSRMNEASFQHPIFTKVKSMIHHHHSKARNRRSSRSGGSMLSSHFEKNDVVLAKHQLRQAALGDEVCAQQCEATDWQCTCANLFTCVQKMSKYDLTVLMAGGYVDDNPSSETYGNFTVSADKLHLFDAEDGVTDKLQRIKSLSTQRPITKQNCAAVLDEIFTACDPSKAACSKTNVESFHVSTMHICAAVNTPTKLLFEVIGDEFDGFIDAGRPASRYVKVQLLERSNLQIAELQVLDPTGRNLALNKPATQSSDYHGQATPASKAVDGNTDTYSETKTSHGNWWEVDLQQDVVVDRIRLVQRRQESFQTQLSNSRIMLIDRNGNAFGFYNIFDSSKTPVFDLSSSDFDYSCGTTRLSKCSPLSFELCRDFVVEFDRLEYALGESSPLRWPSGVYFDKNRLFNVFSNVQFPVEYSFVQDNRGVLDRSTFGGGGQSGDLVIRNTATGKVLGFSGGCEMDTETTVLSKVGPRLEMVEYNPSDNRQRFVVTQYGNIESKHCQNYAIALRGLDEENSLYNECTSGMYPRLYRLDSNGWRVLRGTTWFLNADGSIVSRYPCASKGAGDLALTDIEEDDLKSMTMHTIVLIGNRGISSKVLEHDSNCNVEDDASSTDGFRLKPRGSTVKQQFKVTQEKGNYLIESYECGAKFLSGPPCHLRGTSDWGSVFLAGLEEKRRYQWSGKPYCIRAVTATSALAPGRVKIEIQQTAGGQFETKSSADGDLYQKGDTVIDECFESIERVNIRSGDLDVGKAEYWLGKVEFSVDEGNSWFALYKSGNNRGKNQPGDTSRICVGRESECQKENPSSTCGNDHISWTCPLQPYFPVEQKWIIEEGTIKAAGCDAMVLSNDNDQLKMKEDSDSWRQKWSIISRNAVVSAVGSNREWKLEYVAPGFNYAPVPNFPGNEANGCLTSANIPSIAKTAMHRCDQSMSLLIGSKTSLGTLKAIADEVTADGPSRLPGSCCFDTPADSNVYVGVDFDPALGMQCQNTGPKYLGISEESCNNAGGQWFRSNCHTLKRCIDNRPSRFALDAPVNGDCQDSLKQWNTAYVRVYPTSDFTTTVEANMHCDKACRSLPNYANQLAMIITPDSCICQYEDGMIPSSDLLPPRTIRSPPKFFLKNAADGTSLGLSSNDCTADKIGVEVQTHLDSAQQQFYLSYDNRIVSALCPNKALQASCTEGAYASAVSFEVSVGDSNSEWIISSDGFVSKPGCELKLSSIKDNVGSLQSAYFTLMNSKTNMFITANEGDCAAGLKLSIQREMTGNPGQLFYMVDGRIKSLKCPNLNIDVSNIEPSTMNETSFCSSNETLIQLTAGSGSSRWIFNDLNGTIELDVTTTGCPGKVIDIFYSGLAPASGSPLITANSDGRGSQKWSKNYQKFSMVSDLFSFVNPLLNQAIAVDGDCGLRAPLKPQEDSFVDPSQHFFFGNGVIYSKKCPGLVISTASDKSEECRPEQIQLQTAKGQDAAKWKTNKEGLIESLACPGFIISEAIVAHKVKVQLEDTNYLMLAELEVFDTNEVNRALNKPATQSSTLFLSKTASNAVDGNLTTYTHTNSDQGAWLKVDMQEGVVVDRIRLVQRQEGTNQGRRDIITNATVLLLDHDDSVLASYKIGDARNKNQLIIPISDFTISDRGARLFLIPAQKNLPRVVWSKVNARLLASPNPTVSSNVRFVKVSITGSRKILSFAEVQVIDTSNADRALASKGASASQSSTYSPCQTCGASSAIDGFTGGAITHTNAEANPWWLVDLGGVVDLREIFKVVLWNRADAWGMRLSHATVTLLDQNSNVLYSFNDIGDATGKTLIELFPVSSQNQKWSIEFVEKYDGPSHTSAFTAGQRCFKQNQGFSQSFDDFARNLVITDAGNENQCMNARVGLGFDKEHPYDTEVCDTFRDLTCDIHFTGVDVVSGGLSKPPTFTEVDFEAPEYPDDPKLSFEKLPLLAPWQDPDKVGANEHLVELQLDHLKLEEAVVLTEMGTALLNDNLQFVCDQIPEEITIPAPPPILKIDVPNPALQICVLYQFLYYNLGWLINLSAVLSFNAINLEWTKATRGPNQELDEYFYTEATFKNLKTLNSWTFEALETINRNMMTQHSEMRSHLQDRHQHMVTDIVEIIEDSTNVLGNEFTRTNAWIQKVACETLALTGTKCPTDDEGALLDPEDWPETSMKLWDEIQEIKEQGVSSVDSVARTVEELLNNKMVDTVARVVKDTNAQMVNKLESKVGEMEIKMQVMTDKMMELIQINTKLMEALEAAKN
ncbi:hypothetical protein ACHAXN_004087 [Cyclotella atomus]